MKSSLIPWMKVVLLTKFHLILVTGPVIQIIIPRVTTMANHGTRKATTGHGRTETTNIGRTRIISHGRIKIKSHGKTIIKAKVINLTTLALLCHRIKNSLFQQIVMRTRFQIICTLVKAQINKAKWSGGNTKEINEISKDTLVNLLNISDETYDAAQSAVQQVEKDEISSSSSSTD